MSSNAPLDPNELVTRLKSRDHISLALVYNMYADALYGILVRIVQNYDVADDLLQETFLRVWTRIETLDTNKGTLFTWMLNIARNLAIDYMRSVERRGREILKDPSIVCFEAGDLKVAGPYESVDLPIHISTLPVEQQRIIEMVYYKGYTLAEIAEECSIPLGTVKSRLRLAMNALRGLYGVQHESA